jgi:para-aminobenzoate synthetase/4-amino-4-deoxychorismate lyase
VDLAETDATVEGTRPNATLAPETTLLASTYADRIDRIREYIAAGDVYQVNLTVPFTASSDLSPLATYERMRLAQGGSYSAYLDLGDVQIMSASPELLVARTGASLCAKPMKGTAPRGLDVESDRAARDALLHSEKERAENVMIVDVVRNDLGRVARVGSVRVPSLCDAERYPSVWQLTSTVGADVEPDLPLSSVFAALFPSGSITGAPKIRASRIIRELEDEPRGVYCGAIGMIRPGGDAVFNVAIRTAWTADGGKTVHLNAGGGVTIDSTAWGELAEVRAKLSAFTVTRERPSLFETIRIEQGAPVRLARHLARMGASADYFGITFDAARADEVMQVASRLGSMHAVGRGRLVLAPTGELQATVEPFRDDSAPDRARMVAIAQRPIDSRDVRLYHKTTDRDVYDSAMREAPSDFDVVLWNEKREATELTRGNLVAEFEGARWTPPIACGLLGGTLRGELLEGGEVRERIVTLEQLRSAERIWFVNSLRGWVEIEIEWRVVRGG